MSDTSSGSGRDPVEELLESFLARWRRGERPSPEEYAARCAERADEIRALFPAVVEMERLKPVVDGPTGSPAEPLPRPGSSADAAPPHPERLGEYRILRVLGEGGMGVVYEAEHGSLKNRVALKVMQPRFRTDESHLRRFRIEARSAARLHHTNIVPVFDFGEQDSVCFYAMQLIDGVGLNYVLDDVRRLRAMAESAGQPQGADQADNETIESSKGPLAAVTRSLLTGRFAAGPATPTGSALAATVSIDPNGTDKAPSFVVNDPPDPDPSPPPAPVSAPAPTSSGDGFREGSHSLTGQPEAIYFREIARLGAQVADALDYAHRQGVVHRDIKPSNLMLDAQGNAWVTDFGLAKLVEADDLSRSNNLVGTLRFMAPERFQGVTDRRGDIYALGATLYELLVLCPVFDERDQVRLIDRIAHEPPRPLRQHDPRIPRDLETIVLRTLAKDTKDRCDRAGELRDELRRFLEGRPTRWRRVGPVEQFRRWCKRNPVIAGLNALAATLTIAIAVVSTVAAYRNDRLATQLAARNVEANRNLVQARRNLLQAYTTEAEARRVSRRVGQRFATLDAVKRAMDLAPAVGISQEERLRLRNVAIAAMALPDLRVERTLPLPRSDRNGFAVDPTFERYAFREADGTAVVRSLADGATVFRPPGLVLPPGQSTQASFSRDGRYLAMATFGENAILQVWDLQEQRLVLTDRKVVRANWGHLISWSFHPNSRALAHGRTDGTLVIHELPSGRLIRRWAEHPLLGGILAYSADGSMLALRDAIGGRLKVVASDSGRVLTTLANPSNADHFTWNPRRPKVLAVACAGGSILIWDVATGQTMMTLRAETQSGDVLAFHPNGETLADRGWHHFLRLWDTRTGRMLLNRPSTWWPTLEFDRTGRWLAADASHENVHILEVAGAAEYRTLAREPYREDRHLSTLAIDPTGHRFVTGGTSLTLWDLPTGPALATLPVSGNTHKLLLDASGAILTPSPILLRWPVTEAADGVTTIGPPQLLASRGTSDGLDITPDGRTIAAAMYNDGGLVLDTRAPANVRWLRPQRDVRNIAISPDGRWVVTGSHGGAEGLKLWDARTGRLVHDFPGLRDDETGLVNSFSPDGRWLAVHWDGWVLFETKDWTPRVRLSRGPSHAWGLAFAPDSRTAVYLDHARSAILVEVETGRELARFEDPDQGETTQVAFTSDGSHLLTTLHERAYLHAWDLLAIRRRLAELGLDWGPPVPFKTPEGPGSFPPIPKPFRVDRGQLDLLVAQARLENLGGAIAESEAALRKNADQPGVRARLALLCNNLSWTLATGPEPHRDLTRAVDLARRAVALSHGEAIYLNTLGVALYRAGLDEEAVAVLERSLAASQGATDAFDLYFLAMARHRLGQHTRARADFDQALVWRRDHPHLPNPQWPAELDAFQAEARALLDRPPSELPIDVFAPEPASRR